MGIQELSPEEEWSVMIDAEVQGRKKTVRQVIGKFMDAHPEVDFSINPARGTFSEVHQGLITVVLQAASMGILLETENFSASPETYAIINEEQVASRQRVARIK